MPVPAYIQVILPLRLEWEPCYRVPEGTTVRVGDRVRVLFARKEYVGAVSAVGVQPQTDENRILPILAAEEGLPKVLPDEIKFWRAVSDYYLCSIGEVYKAAYPALKIDQEEVEARARERLEARLERLKDKADKARRDDTRERYKAEIEAVEALLRGEKPTAVPTPVTLSPAQETAAETARKAFADKKTVLLHGVTGSGKTEIYLKLAQETLEKGRNVLFLVPEIALSRQLEDRIAAVFPDVQVFHSGVSAARRSQVASRIRKPGPYLVLGTRSALFLPHHNLGLIIVDEEHDTSYKQDAPAPRYNARESAIMLGVIQQANVVLGSATPSLESLYNAETGRFVKVDLKERFHAGDEAEIRRGGNPPHRHGRRAAETGHDGQFFPETHPRDHRYPERRRTGPRAPRTALLCPLRPVHRVRQDSQVPALPRADEPAPRAGPPGMPLLRPHGAVHGHLPILPG